jgi:phage shock protein PspC (stress-responsive transcriptional regulator)
MIGKEPETKIKAVGIVCYIMWWILVDRRAEKYKEKLN